MEPLLGQIQAFAYANRRDPIGWMACEGQLLNINDNTALFSLVGTMYGGDGVATFGIPDLKEASARDKVIYHIAVQGNFPQFH